MLRSWWRERVASQPDRRALAWLFAIWGASRLFYRWKGIRYDESAISTSYQLIDDRLLRHDFLSSVWHFHAQPPLFNVVVGLLMRMPGPDYVAFALCYLLLGVGLTASLFLLQRELGVPRLFAGVVTALFVLSPAAVLYENYFFYTYPVAVALCAAMLFLVRFVRGGQTRHGVFAFSLLASVALVRASFHLAWLAFIVAVVAVAMGRVGWKRAVTAGVVPLVLVGGWYAKQYREFGTFSSSSWLGMSLAKVAYFDVPPSVVARYVNNGTLSKRSLDPIFGRAIQYGYQHDGHSGIAVLDLRDKHTRQPNFGFSGYVPVSKQFQKDAIAFIEKRPGTYATNVQYAARYFLLPAADYSFLIKNHNRVNNIERAYDEILFWQRAPYSAFLPRPYHDLPRNAPQARNISWGLIAMYLGAIALGPVMVWRWRRRRPRADRAAAVTTFVLSLTVLYAVFVDTFFELGENNRFRFETDPLVCVAVAVVLTGAARWWTTRRTTPQTDERL